MTDEQLTRLLRELLEPVKVEQQQAEAQARAELRDRFAGYAIIGLLAAGDAHLYNRDEMAAEAWEQADAMLKARGQ